MGDIDSLKAYYTMLLKLLISFSVTDNIDNKYVLIIAVIFSMYLFDLFPETTKV
jgi:hypothetical protein